jgi:hypothetical protein
VGWLPSGGSARVSRPSRLLDRRSPAGVGVGEVTIFNRSHYEDVSIARVHELVPQESILGHEHTLDDPAILLWNDDHHANSGG